MTLAPIRLILGAFDQVVVVHLQQLQLFEVGVGQPPAFAEIDDEPVVEDITQRSAIPRFHGWLDALLLNKVIGLQLQCHLSGLCEFFMAQQVV